MCFCESCSWIDDWCGTLKKKIWAFAVFMLISGSLTLIFGIWLYIHFNVQDSLKVKQIYMWIFMAMIVLQLLAGLLILYSIYASNAPLLMTSLVFGSIDGNKRFLTLTLILTLTILTLVLLTLTLESARQPRSDELRSSPVTTKLTLRSYQKSTNKWSELFDDPMA